MTPSAFPSALRRVANGNLAHKANAQSMTACAGPRRPLHHTNAAASKVMEERRVNHGIRGAAHAIEDAGALGDVLTCGQNIDASPRAYQGARCPRAARGQRESRRQATIYHLGGPAALLRDMALRALG